MKASKFSDAQKAFVLKQGEEGTPVAEICRKAGISHPIRQVPKGLPFGRRSRRYRHVLAMTQERVLTLGS